MASISENLTQPRTNISSSDLSALSEASVFTIVIFVSIIIATSLTGNLFVSYTLYKGKLLGSISSYLVVNLVVVDLGMSLLVLPTTITTVVNRGWYLGVNMCMMTAFFDRLITNAQVMALLFIGINRFVAVHRPIMYGSSKNRILSKWMVISGWLYSFGWCLPPFFGLGKFSYSKNMLFCSFDYRNSEPSFAVSHFLLSFVFPACIGLVLYISVLRGVYKHFHQVSSVKLDVPHGIELGEIHGTVCNDDLHDVASLENSTVEASNANEQKQSSVDKKSSKLHRLSSKHLRKSKELNQVTKAFLVIVLTFAVCWIPRSIANIWTVIKGRDSVPLALEIFSTILIFSTCALNPLVYGFCRSDFRKAFKMVFCCWRTSEDI